MHAHDATIVNRAYLFSMRYQQSMRVVLLLSAASEHGSPPRLVGAWRLREDVQRRGSARWLGLGLGLGLGFGLGWGSGWGSGSGSG